MKQLKISFSVCIVLLVHSCWAVVGNSSLAVDPFAAAQNPCSNIQNAEFVCIDCQTLGFCSQMNGLWITVEVGSCSGAWLYCDETSRGCKLADKCELEYRGPQFECQNSGIFPDPYNCRYYHECSAVNALTTHVCSNGLGYDLATGSCSLSRQSEQCTERQYECETPWQMGAWPADANIFYVCIPNFVDGEMVFYPLLYRCPTGAEFNGSRCVTVEEESTKSVATTESTQTTTTTQTTESTTQSTDSTTTTQSTTSTQTTESTTTTESSILDQCVFGSLVAHPTNCNLYYYCGSTLVLHTCPSGTRFDSTYQMCTFGTC